MTTAGEPLFSSCVGCDCWVCDRAGDPVLDRGAVRSGLHPRQHPYAAGPSGDSAEEAAAVPRIRSLQGEPNCWRETPGNAVRTGDCERIRESTHHPAPPTPKPTPGRQCHRYASLGPRWRSREQPTIPQSSTQANAGDGILQCAVPGFPASNAVPSRGHGPCRPASRARASIRCARSGLRRGSEDQSRGLQPDWVVRSGHRYNSRSSSLWPWVPA